MVLLLNPIYCHLTPTSDTWILTLTIFIGTFALFGDSKTARFAYPKRESHLGLEIREYRIGQTSCSADTGKK